MPSRSCAFCAAVSRVITARGSPTMRAYAPSVRALTEPPPTAATPRGGPAPARSQVPLGALPGPAVRRVPDVHELAAAERPEAQPERHAATGRLFDHAAGAPTRHQASSPSIRR